MFDCLTSLKVTENNIFHCKCFLCILKRNLEKVKDLYINNGGRKGIHELVALYHTQTEDSDEISDSDIDLTSDSEIDEGNDDHDDDQNHRGNAFAIKI